MIADLITDAKQQESPPALAGERVRGFVIGPYPAYRNPSDSNGRDPEARLQEAVGLARAIDLEICGQQIVMLNEIKPATFLGKGKVADLVLALKLEAVDLVIMDCALSPVQQRNLEKELGVKVIDRTGLILEIFGRRARTREGALQVELAHLAYQKSRLVRSWTHLERQRGGFGFLGGPGETQIETDRRLIQERMTRIERDLDGVKRTRGLHRKRRRDAPYPVVALVGYTNAGKSTLFNRLTQADVFAENLLFATLDPTMRLLRLPHGMKALLSDTVGFISDLPTMLVSAFRATLEEVLEAEVILHVRDVAHEDSEAQSADVQRILSELGVAPDDDRRVIEVWNKSDLLSADRKAGLSQAAAASPDDKPHPILASAVTGEGMDGLLAEIERRLAADRVLLEVDLPGDDGAGLAWAYENAEVLSRRTNSAGDCMLVLRIAPEQVARLLHKYPEGRLRA